MHLVSFRAELLKIASEGPSTPPPLRAIAKGPSIPRPGGLKPPPLPTAAQGGDMWSAISQGMAKARGTPSPMVGILKNAAPTPSSGIMPRPTAAAKLIGARSMAQPRLPSADSFNATPPSGSGFLMASQTMGTVAPPARRQMQAPVHATMPAPGSERMMTHAPTMMPGKVAAAIRKYAAGFTISPEARANLPKKDFAVSPKKSNTGKEAYPIPDRRHAGIALGFSKMHGDTADYEAVRAKVKKLYPDMLEAHDKRHAAKEKAAGISDHALEHIGLATLAVPSLDEGQAHLRARLAGDKSKDAVEKREFLPSAVKPVSELTGLGTLAVPAYRAMRSHAA